MSIKYIPMKVKEFVTKYLEGERNFSGISLPNGSNLEPHIQKLNSAHNSENRIILQHAQLIGLQAPRIEFPHADFRGADLNKSNFLHSDFKYSDFRDTNLQNINFEQARLEDSYFLNANLDSANFIEAYLKEVDFRNANLQNVNFNQAHIRGVNFENADLREVKNLTSAKNLSYARFSNTRIDQSEREKLERIILPLFKD